MLKILMIGMGGFTGSVCRHLTYEFSNKIFDKPFLPYGTIMVNIAGCLFIGFLGGLFETKGDSLIVKGKHQLAEKVLIPRHKVVVFEAGAEIEVK